MHSSGYESVSLCAPTFAIIIDAPSSSQAVCQEHSLTRNMKSIAKHWKVFNFPAAVIL